MMRSRLFFVLALTALIIPARLESQVQNLLPHQWAGTLKIGSAGIRLVFHIREDSLGTLRATMDSPDQGATDIGIDTVIVKGDSVRLTLNRLRASFEGQFVSADTTLTGVWNQGGMSLPIVLKRSISEIVVRRPQEPAKPYPYDEEEVVYPNTRADISLAGTMTLPRRATPAPAVILVSGSGPQDRDETVFGHRPFLVLADYLTRQGIAVLRFDDRGVGKSSGSHAAATTLDFVTDAVAGVEFLKSRKEIDPKKIGIIGHSEGGLIAPLVALESRDVAFIVLLAGPGLPGEEILYRQGVLLAKAASATDAAASQNLMLQKKLFAVVKQEKDSATLHNSLLQILKNDPNQLSDAVIQAQLRSLTSPWFRFFLTYDPRPALSKVTCPVLALIGEKDLQLPAKENLKEIDAALRKGGNKNFVVKELPGLNHLFQTAETGGTGEYATIEETFSPIALKEIGEWIMRQK